MTTLRDSGSANGMTGTVPLFTPIAAPEILSISHEALVEWRRKRRDYEDKLRARCRVSGEDYAVIVEPVINAFEPDLLDVFCDLKLRQASADVTEGMLMAEIEHISSSVKNQTLPDIKNLFKKELKMNMKESDVEARVLDYFKTFNRITMDNGLAECFGQVDGAREKCKRLIASPQPKTLKHEVKQCVRFTHKAAATDTRLLFDLIVEKSTEHERQYQLLKQRLDSLPGRDSKESKGKNMSPPPNSKKRWHNQSSVNLVVPTTQAGSGANVVPARPQGEQRPRSSGGPPGPCLKCKEMHWLRDCTKASDQEKNEILKRFREARNKKKARIKRLGECIPDSERKVTLNGVLELPYCADSGSDFTVIGRSFWNKLRLADPSVVAEELDVPMCNQTFGASWVMADSKACLYVMIHTAAGPVELTEPVDVLIVDVDDDEFIVGNDLLVLLGINVDQQLEQLASRGDDDTSGDSIELEADEMPFNPDEPASTSDDIFAAVERLVTRALECGFPLDRVDQLRTIVHAYDVWRLELRADLPANVPPLDVRLREGARPSKCKPRKYPPHIRKFLREFNARLVELGMVYENPNSRWASPVLPVKQSSDMMDLRQITDYREQNEKTETMAAVMPILSLVLENARGMEHFGLFDFLKGFWQLPLAELCQEFLSYITDEKIFTPRRVPQGCSDAAIFFQKTMEECFTSLLYKHLLIWIDDILLYADDIDVYLDKLAEFCSLLDRFGLKLSAKKCSLYQTEVKWCGKLINSHGVRHDPERISTLRAMPYPQNAAELQQFVCAINWMRESIVDYARQVAPLQKRLDQALASTKRTKRAAAGIELELTEEERQAFDAVKEMLASAATLDFPLDGATTCLFTDASDIGWSVIVTQVINFDSIVPATDQQHRLLQCLCGTFTVIEKEAFPIVMACDKLDYLLLRPEPFRMYCDHRNLIHVFAPHESVNKHVKGKLLRWAMKFMNFRYVVEDLPGPANVWADMISRWAGNHSPTAIVKRLKAVRRRTTPTGSTGPTPLRPLDEENFVWPTLAELFNTQAEYEALSVADRNEEGLLTIDNKLWVPAEAKDLIQRLCIVAHCGAQGHRGQHAMIAHLSKLFVIDHLSAIVASFVGQYLLCLHSRGGKIIPRPWGETVECNVRNDVLHFDYLYMGPSYGNSKYLLVLKNHATHYCELVVADTADSQVVTEALLAWHSRFGIPPDWISDQGTYFKNEVVAELGRRLRVHQEFTPAYCPWINGSIERVNRDILQVVRAMILEYKISYKDWVYLVPMVQATLNHTAVPSLDNKAPVELFTDLERPTPLKEFYLPDKDELQTVPECGEIDAFLDKLRSSIQDMHKPVEDRKEIQRLLNQKRQRGENLANFSVGDFVLRSRVDEKHSNKLQVTWVGPYRVVRADAHSFRVQHLVTAEELNVHASRLKLYADDSLDVPGGLLEHVAAQGILLAVEDLKEHRWNDAIKDFEILVAWKRLQSIEDSYEPMLELAKEIRVLVDKYVDQAGTKN